MAACDPREIMQVASCWNCLDARQMVMAWLTISCKILQNLNPMASCDVNSIMADAACWSCLSGNQLWMAMLQIQCEILQAGGGGTVCNLCVEGADPVAPAPCDCSHYTRTDTGEMWYWRPLTAEWIKYISST